MVVVSILPHAEFGRNDHRKDATHFMKLILKTTVCPSEQAIYHIFFLSWVFRAHEFTESSITSAELLCVALFDGQTVVESKIQGYIYVGDGCWRRNVLMTILKCW